MHLRDNAVFSGIPRDPPIPRRSVEFKGIRRVVSVRLCGVARVLGDVIGRLGETIGRLRVAIERLKEPTA